MDESFSSEHVQTPSIWEHKGDTSTTAFPNLFFDDSISSVGGASCADPSIHLSTDCTDDGGYSTITNVIAEGIRSKSTFEVIEIDSSSSCAGCDELVLKRLSDVSPSFPDGTIVNSPHDQYQEQGNYHDPIDRQDAIIHVNDDQDFNADNSIAMSSLTNNESSLSVRWRSATDRMGMLFKPFRDASRPQVTSFDETYGSDREVSGLNSFIVTSPENVLSIFRPQPHPEFHIRQSTPVISSSCSPENLVITTTHSHNTHSICMVGSDIEVRNSEEHSVPQPFTDDKRDRYGAAVMRSYQPKQHPFMLLSSFAENAKCKKLHIMSLLIISALLVGIISVTIIAGGESNVLNEESITNSAEKQPQESGQDNVSLPSACCINHVDHFDAMQKETENNKVKQELYTSIFDHDVVALPAIMNGTYTEDTLMNNPSLPIESVEDIGSISSASSKKKKEKKNEQSPNLPSNDKGTVAYSFSILPLYLLLLTPSMFESSPEGRTETVTTYPVTPEPSSSSPSKVSRTFL